MAREKTADIFKRNVYALSRKHRLDQRKLCMNEALVFYGTFRVKTEIKTVDLNDFFSNIPCRYRYSTIDNHCKLFGLSYF